MYSETDLDLVASSIPIYTKAEMKGKPKTPQRGHFGCQGCDSGRLSGTRTYITALVYDFDLIGPCFAFLFSRADTHYTPPNDAFTQLMATTINYDWIYRAKDEIRNTLVHVRGWWNLQRDLTNFNHKNGVINLGDHVNFDDPDMDGDTIINPEFGIKMFIAPYAGMYRNPGNLEHIGNWNEEDTYANTFVHPGTDRIAKVMNPEWKRYGTPKATKKPKHTRRRGLRGGGDEDVPPPPDVRTIEEREAALRAMQQATRPRRRNGGAPPLGEERGRIRFTNPEMDVDPGMQVNPEMPDQPRWTTATGTLRVGEVGIMPDVQARVEQQQDEL